MKGQSLRNIVRSIILSAQFGYKPPHLCCGWGGCLCQGARVKSESGLYHVIAKGSGGQNLFEGPYDYQAFLEFLSKACEKGGVRVIAYCLMSNHVHLLLEDAEDHLGEVMKSVLTSYAQRFNKSSDHVGHVFQQRFKSQPIENGDYLLRAIRYIHNNPAKVGICPAEDYPRSSYHEYVGTPVLIDAARLGAVWRGRGICCVQHVRGRGKLSLFRTHPPLRR